MRLPVIVAMIAVFVYSATAKNNPSMVIIHHVECGFGLKGQENK
jgi:hypothetical protein